MAGFSAANTSPPSTAAPTVVDCSFRNVADATAAAAELQALTQVPSLLDLQMVSLLKQQAAEPAERRPVLPVHQVDLAAIIGFVLDEIEDF